MEGELPTAEQVAEAIKLAERMVKLIYRPGIGGVPDRRLSAPDNAVLQVCNALIARPAPAQGGWRDEDTIRREAMIAMRDRCAAECEVLGDRLDNPGEIFAEHLMGLSLDVTAIHPDTPKRPLPPPPRDGE